MPTDEELVARDVIALKELNTSLVALSKSLDDLPKTIKYTSSQLTSLIQGYTEQISKLKEENYASLSPDDRNAINNLQLAIGKLYGLASKSLKSEKSRHTKDQRTQNIRSLETLLDALLTASARDKSYADQTLNKSVHMPKSYRKIHTGRSSAEKPITDNTATKETEIRAKEYSKSTKELAKSFTTLSKNFLQSMRVQPASSRRIDAPEEDETDDVDKSITTFDRLYRGFAMFSDALVSFNGAVVSFTSAMGSAFSSIMSGFADLLTGDPISGVVSMIQGMSTMMTAALDFVSSMLDSFSSILSSLIEPTKHNDDTDSTGGLMKILGSIVSMILSIISSIITVAMQAIQSAFQMFASTLQAIFKIIKKIALTSPVIKAILELLNLAFTLFFMPFMNSFALVLLPYVIDLLDWTITNGQKYAELGRELGETFAALITADNGILVKVTDLATKFIEGFAPDFMKIMKGQNENGGLLGFAKAFTDALINNKDKIIDFLEKGLEAFKAMVDAGFLDKFLEFGTNVMKWMEKNADDIVQITSGILNGLLKISEFFVGLVGGSDKEQGDYSDETSAVSTGDESVQNKLNQDRYKNDAGVQYFNPNNVTAENARDRVSTKWGSNVVKKKAKEYGVSEDYIRNMTYEQYVAMVNGIPVSDLPYRKALTDSSGSSDDGIAASVDISDIMNSVARAAKGGKFTLNGGVPVLAGEGGEGEYKLSETELKEIGKDTTVSVQVNGTILSKMDFKEAVRRSVTDISTKSYYR